MDQRERGTDIVEALRVAMEGYSSEVWTALPGIISAYNPTKQTASVTPAILINTRDQYGNFTQQQIPDALDVPVVFPSGGGFAVSWVPAVGDEVLLVFSCRCIDNWWAASGPAGSPTPQTQAELRLHSLSDGFAIPGPKSVPNAATVVQPTNSMRLGLTSGTAYVEVTAAGAVNVVAPGGLTINGTVLVEGALLATGELTAVSTSPSPIPLSQHVHGSTSTPLVPFTGVPLP